jgi:hypothetical protein
MKIKQLIQFDEKLNKEFYDFCCKSQPYDFCSIKSRLLRNIKIQEYLNVLYSSCEIYYAEIDNERIATCFFLKQNDHISLEFIFGNFNKYNSVESINATHLIFKFFLEKSNHTKIISIIQRKYKKRQFLKWIKKYDKKCEIFENIDNIEDTQIIWTYERLS